MKYKNPKNSKRGIPHTSYAIPHTREAGFTLVEMIVSVALFAIVMVVAVGAMLSLTVANKKAQGIQSVMNNLNITLDSMVRNIRMGTGFDASTGCAGNGGGPKDCTSGSTTFTFTCNTGTAVCGSSGGRWSYRFVCPGSLDGTGACPAGGYIQRSQDGGATWPSTGTLTSEEVSIQHLTFYVVGTRPGDFVQPKVIMVVSGTAGGQNVKTKTSFHIQATAVQRELDL